MEAHAGVCLNCIRCIVSYRMNDPTPWKSTYKSTESVFQAAHKEHKNSVSLNATAYQNTKPTYSSGLSALAHLHAFVIAVGGRHQPCEAVLRQSRGANLNQRLIGSSQARLKQKSTTVAWAGPTPLRRSTRIGRFYELFKHQGLAFGRSVGNS
eukprot:7066219-Pyramimonas_sp.AAC.1